MKRVTQFLVSLALLVLPVLPAQSAHLSVPHAASAIETTCPTIVQRAWKNVDTLCDATDRNEACYGHVMLEARPQPGVMDFEFEREGQMVDVVKLQSLRLSTMDLLSGTWGVALMQIQANLPAFSTNKNVSLLLFGDVMIEDATVPKTFVDVTPRSMWNIINVRYQPSTRSGVVGLVQPDDVVVADGRLASGSWLHVQLAETDTSGWVYAPLFESTDDTPLESLSELDPTRSNFGPMQAFYFQSGKEDAMCPEAPNSGILIQTPEGVAEVTLLINEVDIRLGSTVYFQATPGQDMSVSVVEGHARVTSGGETQLAFAGTQVSVPLDNAGKPSGVPTRARPYDMANVRGLPVEYMDTPVVIADPMLDDQIERAIAEAEADASGNGSEPADDGDDQQSDDGGLPPGLVDNPGLGTDDEGNPILPPGHGGDTPPGIDSGDDGDPIGGEDDETGEDNDLPPGLVDNPGLGDNLPPGQGGDTPPGRAGRDD